MRGPNERKDSHKNESGSGTEQNTHLITLLMADIGVSALNHQHTVVIDLAEVVYSGELYRTK